MKTTRPSSTLRTALFAILAFAASRAGAQPFYRLESAVTMKSAAPSWDYVRFEPARAYLFIGRRADGLTVYDTKGGKIVCTIENSIGANAATLVPEFDRGYTVNGDGSTTVFRLSTLQTLGRVELGDAADNAFYEPVSKQLAFTLGDSQEVVFVAAPTGAVVGRLKTASHNLDGAAADGKGALFVAQRDRNSVVRLDVGRRAITAEWPVKGAEEPTGLAFDPATRRIFVGCRGRQPVLAVLDADTGRVVTTVEIGRGNDGVIFDSETRKIYTSNGVDGNLVIYDQLDADTYRLSEATTTRPYARTMALEPKSKKVFLVTAEGTVDPAKKVNRGPAPFYPNVYFPDTFVLLTYSRR